MDTHSWPRWARWIADSIEQWAMTGWEDNMQLVFVRCEVEAALHGGVPKELVQTFTRTMLQHYKKPN